MGTKRVGLARIEALLEAQARDLAMGGDTIFSGVRAKVDNSTFNTGGAVTSTLTRAQSGTHFNVDGTDDIVVNMPALSTSNVGLNYSFLVTTAVSGDKTVTFVLPGSGVSNWFATIFQEGSGSEPSKDITGDTLTLINATAVGSKVEMLCVVDDGTNSTWQVQVISAQLATVD